MITVQAAITLLAGAKAPAKAQFDEITVGRINIQEPDGTPRMMLLVSARGQPEIRMLDETGKVVRSVDAE